MTADLRRCGWARNPLSVAYHDREWGVPVRDDRTLFEFLVLEGAQAGLSWDTILAKRENYRKALDGFDFERIASYDAKKKRQLLANPGIVRNRAKIEATILNARATLEVLDEFGSLASYLWTFVDGKPVQNHWAASGEVPATTEASEQMSKALLKRGFRFVGPTICYAFMQAVGMVNDHIVACYRHPQLTHAKSG